MNAPWLPQAQFEAALAALPLVSVDWVLSDPSGAVLCGHRLNAPARATWFTPGGRVHKGESLASALARVAASELGAPAAQVVDGWVQRARLMGAWDHFYADSAFSASAPTHYVNLPHWLPLSWSEVEALAGWLPLGEQHSAWRWVPCDEARAATLAPEAEQSPSSTPAPAPFAANVHEHVAPYLAWVSRALTAPETAQGLTP